MYKLPYLVLVSEHTNCVRYIMLSRSLLPKAGKSKVQIHLIEKVKWLQGDIIEESCGQTKKIKVEESFLG